MNLEIGAEAALFPEKEYKGWLFQNHLISKHSDTVTTNVPNLFVSLSSLSVADK